MKSVPEYYEHFKCTADKCAHSCCKDWEIDIDLASYKRYLNKKGEIGDKLRQNIVKDEEGIHFRLTEDECCPFLQSDGLCELIISCGEKSLCQICADHPRFVNDFTGCHETGLGLCCEAAAKLILTWQYKFKLVQTDDKPNKASKSLKELIDARQKLFDILTDRSMPLNKRIELYMDDVSEELPEYSFEDWRDFYKGLEILDEEWEELLYIPEREVPENDSPELEIAFEQLIVYFLFRHLLASEEDDKLIARLLFPVHALDFIRRIFYSHGCIQVDFLCNIARLYSAEIEYSDENLDFILDELDKYEY